MLGGRVKTLHPRIHGGILARRDSSDDLAALDEQEIEPFDVVCVNFYPFSSITAQRGARMDDAVEMIDIGGPSMLRAAAKNFAHVAPVSGPEQYARVLADLRETGAVSQATRRELAAVAFAKTAAYEASIARWFAEGEGLPDTLSLAFEKVQDLAYGENPHQRAAYYREVGARRPLLSHVEQLHGRELSFNNLHDLSGALHAAARVHAAGLRDRQARERVRRRGRRDDRGGVRARARVRSALRVRDGLRAQPAGDAGARGDDRAAVRRRPLRARLRGRRARCVEREAADAHPRRPRAPRVPRRTSSTTSASPAGCSCRTATGTSRRARR